MTAGATTISTSRLRSPIPATCRSSSFSSVATGPACTRSFWPPAMKGCNTGQAGRRTMTPCISARSVPASRWDRKVTASAAVLSISARKATLAPSSKWRMRHPNGCASSMRSGKRRSIGMAAIQSAGAGRAEAGAWARMKIVIPDDYQDTVDRLACFSLLRGHEVTRYRAPAENFEQLVARLHPAEVIVAIRERVTFSRDLIERLPNLRLLALVGRNATTIDYAACTEHKIRVATGASNSPVSPAELTVALMVAARRNIAHEAARMKRGEWPETLSHRLRGSTLGIFGLGAIGSLVAEAAFGLGMRILVWGQAHSAAKARERGYAVADGKAALFEQSDVLSLHVRLRPDTRGIVGPDVFARMKPTALLVNTSRAELIAPGALVAALRAG